MALGHPLEGGCLVGKARVNGLRRRLATPIHESQYMDALLLRTTPYRTHYRLFFFRFRILPVYAQSLVD